MNQTLRTKKGLGLLISFVFLLIAGISVLGLRLERSIEHANTVATNLDQIRTVLTEITIHRLEQVIALERAVRYGMDPEKTQRFRQMQSEFQTLGSVINKEIARAEALISPQPSPSNGPRKLEILLKTLLQRHRLFERDAKSVLALMQAGEVEQAKVLSNRLLQSKNQLQDDLKSILTQFEDFTNHFAKDMQDDQTDARGDFFVLWITGLLAGFCFGGLVTYRLVQGKLHREVQTVLLLRIVLKKLRSMYRKQYANSGGAEDLGADTVVGTSRQSLHTPDNVTVIASEHSQEASKKK